MAQTLYQVLGLTEAAPQELVEESYRILVKKLEARAGQDEDARNRLVSVKEAYRTLGDPERRAHYDSSLRSPGLYAEPRFANTAQLRGYDADQSRWKSWLVAGAVVALVAFAGQRYYVTHIQSEVARAADRQRAEVDRIRALNEGRMVDGLIGNQADQISSRSQIENRRLGIQESAEQRYSSDSDNRYRIQQQQIELQRQRQQAQTDLEYSRQQSQLHWQQRAAQDRAAAAEQARIDKLNKYNACVASAMGKQGYDGARQRCLAYQ